MPAIDTTELRNQIATRPKTGGGGKTIKQVVQEQHAQIARALPSMVTPERFVRTVLTELSRTPKLAECSAESVLGALMYAAQLGLELGPLGHAYLIPYGPTATLILGYKGLIALARRSGEILSIEAREVRENDTFEYEYGLNDRLVHRPALGERGAAVRYYGIAKFKDGGHYFLVMELSDIDKRKARSASAKRGDSPWKSDPEAMSMKTVIRAMQPWLPLTAEVAEAFDRDERIVARFDPDASEPLQLTETPYDDEGPVDAAALPAATSPAGAGGSLPEQAAPETVDVEEPGPGADTATGPSGDDGEVAASSTQLVGPEGVDVEPVVEAATAPSHEQAPSGPAMETYKTWTAAQLLDELDRRKLPTGGHNRVLRDRLIADDEKPF